MFYQHYLGDGIQFNPSIEFGNKHSYRTRQSPWFANIPHYKNALASTFFRYQATTWWNSLPSIFFQDITSLHDNFADTFARSDLIYLLISIILWVVIAFVLVMVYI